MKKPRPKRVAVDLSPVDTGLLDALHRPLVDTSLLDALHGKEDAP
jgi:hypothetical protein